MCNKKIQCMWVYLIRSLLTKICIFPWQYVYMNIFVHIEDRIIDLVRIDNLLSPGDGYIKASNFTLYGRHIGVTTLYVSSMLLCKMVID